ncbi:TRAP transporter small permease subunit [Melaminivora alkalimesophila]|uniref:TRAP transporter small permease protein n=1 Tax=Melaminivora alkalimesophila TaxID=1165852 RepID=A0A317RGI7_9BURK|nr:TRAP transporter small permease subunit [Melaminivora alkalimesophila]PWW48933.1 TRAP-type mannitol/chloroaromatic compound transport system permease small subunit [Melaminivora alkalimesophila]
MMKLLAAVDRFSLAFGKLVSYLVWIGIVIVVLEVVLRYVFNAPTVWGPGYTQRIFGAYFVLIGAYTLLQGGHVRVDLLLNTRSPRWNAFLDFLNYAVLMVWMLALVYEGWSYFQESWEFSEVDDSALGHPLWPVKLALLLGVTGMLVQGAVELLRSLVGMVDPAALPPKRQEVQP